VEKVVPVWFLLGFLHYGLEFLYRVLRLEKRLVIPICFEKMLIGIDEVIFKLPFCKRFAWNYTVVFRKGN